MHKFILYLTLERSVASVRHAIKWNNLLFVDAESARRLCACWRDAVSAFRAANYKVLDCYRLFLVSARVSSVKLELFGVQVRESRLQTLTIGKFMISAVDAGYVCARRIKSTKIAQFPFTGPNFLAQTVLLANFLSDKTRTTSSQTKVNGNKHYTYNERA